MRFLHGCSPVNLRYIFSTPFCKNTSKGLLLNSWVTCFEGSFPANIRRPDEDDFHLRLQKTSSRRLQGNLIKTNIFSLVKHLQKTSWSRPIYSSCSYVFKTSSRRLAKMSSRHLQDVFKTSCKNIFETYHPVKLFLLTSLRDVLNTFLKRTAKTVIPQKDLPRSHFW